MKIIRAATAVVLATCLLGVYMPLNIMAATIKTITTVGIKVTMGEFQPGDRLPDIQINDSSGLVSVSSSSGKYHISSADWETSTSKDVTVGEQPRMKVTLTADSPDEYSFRGGYQASNVSVTGGTFMTAKRDGADNLVVTLRVKPIKGTYEAPTDAYWKDNSIGHAKWEEPVSTSGAYDVYLYKGGTVIKKAEGIKATAYNFYPYMTKEGSYSFKVRTVPYSETEKQYGKKSSWTDSEEYYVPVEKVSDGSGQSNDDTGPDGYTGKVGWIQDGQLWFYRYPDGSYLKGTWSKINDKWYLFDDRGAMLIGWQQRNNISYFLKDSGDMATGWQKVNEKWYYFNPGIQGVEGALCTGWISHNNKWYYCDAAGIMVEGWYQVDGNWYYFYPGEGSKAVNTTIDTFYVDASGIWHKPENTKD